ncbi:hypothetical protein LABO110987_03785 [Lactobacillus bombicola]
MYVTDASAQAFANPRKSATFTTFCLYLSGLVTWSGLAIFTAVGALLAVLPIPLIKSSRFTSASDETVTSLLASVSAAVSILGVASACAVYSLKSFLSETLSFGTSLAVTFVATSLLGIFSELLAGA